MLMHANELAGLCLWVFLGREKQPRARGDNRGGCLGSLDACTYKHLLYVDTQTRVFYFKNVNSFFFTLYKVRSVQTCVLKSCSVFEIFIIFQGHFGPYILPYVVDDNPK